MDNNLMPQASQPVQRIAAGQLPSELAELSEEALNQLGSWDTNASSASIASVLNSVSTSSKKIVEESFCLTCSYDGDDAE